MGAKHPASTIQVLGAEKALFRALKTKKDTPKYGLIYHASLVGQSSAKNKGKMSRMLAAKAALALRYDAFGDADDSTMELGINSRAKLEVRLKVLETGKVEKSPFKKDEKKSAGAFSVKSETVEYDGAADSTLKRMKEEAMEETEAPPKKKKKKDKKVKEEVTPEAEEEEVTAEVESVAEPEKKKKKSKKSKKASDDEEVAEVAEKVEEMEVEEAATESPKKKKKKKKSAE